MKRVWAIAIFCIFCLGMVSSAQAGNPIRLAITDLEGLEQLQREFGAFKDELSKATGLEFEFYPVSSRTAAVEAMRSKQVEFVLTGPAEYVIFKKKAAAEPVVGFSRPDYFCSIVVMADSGLSTLDQLKGKKVVFGDVGSTSKHLAPMQVFSDYGVNPRTELQATHVGYKVGWEALKRGDVDALATTTDKFVKMRDEEKELPAGAFRVIGRSGDLPNDVLAVAPHVDAAVTAKVKKVFTEETDKLVAAILKGEDNQKYKGMKFLGNVKDEDYNYVRKMYATIGYPEYSEFLGN